MKTLLALVVVATIGCNTTSTGKSAIGDACQQDSDCLSDTCGGSPDCGRACTCRTDADCPGGGQCTITTDCGNACVPADGGATDGSANP